jgi:dolichol kinase
MAVSKKEHVPLKFIELAEASLSISECNRSGILLQVISVVLFILHSTAFQVSLPNKLQRMKSVNNLLIHCAYYEKHTARVHKS